MLAARIVWSPEIAEDIAANALQILVKASNRKIIFFNGQAPRCLLGGLFYILGYRFNQVATQREIAEMLGVTEGSISKSYKHWLKEFPELFTDITAKMSKLNTNFEFQQSIVKRFDKVLLESVDEGFASLGENAKTLIFSHLERYFMITRVEIPCRLCDFSDALEQIFGLGARHLEILIMRKLHEKVDYRCGFNTREWFMPDFTFTKYVDLMRIMYENTGKNGDAASTVETEQPLEISKKLKNPKTN
jgi:hypothetical protein